jgi:hypothetical protein
MTFGVLAVVAFSMADGCRHLIAKARRDAGYMHGGNLTQLLAQLHYRC